MADPIPAGCTSELSRGTAIAARPDWRNHGAISKNNPSERNNFNPAAARKRGIGMAAIPAYSNPIVNGLDRVTEKTTPA